MLFISDEDDYDERYVINLNDPLKSPPNIMIIYAREIETPKKIVDTLEIKYLPWDVWDCYGEGKMVKAKIVKNGRAIEVILPRLPYGLIYNWELMYENEVKSKKLDATKNAHKVFYNGIKSEIKERNTKKILLELPSGIRVKGLPFNRHNKKLENNLRFSQHEKSLVDDNKKMSAKKRTTTDMDAEQEGTKVGAVDQAMVFKKSYIFWTVAIDAKARILNDNEVEDDDFISACKHFANVAF